MIEMLAVELVYAVLASRYTHTSTMLAGALKDMCTDPED